MKILIVASYNKNRYAPFIVEQAETIANELRNRVNSEELRVKSEVSEVEWFGVQGKGIMGYLKAVPKLRAKIKECKPDVVHAHYGLSCLLTNLATRRVPVVSTYHGSDINEPKVLPFSKVAMWLSAWNIFVSQRNVDIAKPYKHWSLIPCGINLPQPWSELKDQLVEQLTLNQWVEGVLEKGKKHVLFAGAFDNTVKDPQLAMDVIARVNSEELIVKSGGVQLVELKGYTRDQVNALMYNCDAFLMTSKTEGSPQVIKEAMACGCPIVSVDVGDVKERTEGVDGCYVVPSREPKDIAAALEKAIAFEGKTKGRERIIADELTNELVAKRIIEIYERVKR